MLPVDDASFERAHFDDDLDFASACINRGIDIRFVPAEKLDNELGNLRRACFVELESVDEVKRENLGRTLRALYAVDVEYTAFEDGIYTFWLDPLEHEKGEADGWSDIVRFASRTGVELRLQSCR